MESKKWGIIGGGIMGMTLAHRLAQQGHEVTIFEAAPYSESVISSLCYSSNKADELVRKVKR